MIDTETRAVLATTFDLARGGDAVALSAYLDAGVPVDLTNDRGDTLLILAAYHAHAACVDVLLRAGAEVDRENDNGQTALAAAVFRQTDGIVAALLAAGASPLAGRRSAESVADFFGLAGLRRQLAGG